MTKFNFKKEEFKGLNDLLKVSLNVEESDISKLIDSIHQKINNTSFNTSKIKMLREIFFDSKLDNKVKP